MNVDNSANPQKITNTAEPLDQSWYDVYPTYPMPPLDPTPWIFKPPVQFGWQCPVCLNVWGPSIPQCFHCSNDLAKRRPLGGNVNIGRNFAGS